MESRYASRELIAAFHAMWDGFPGAARLIGRDHVIIAANEAAIKNGHVPGVCCAKLPSATNHRGCMAHETMETGEGHADNPTGSSIRGWVPVEGNRDVFVHFTLAVPEAGFKK